MSDRDPSTLDSAKTQQIRLEALTDERDVLASVLPARLLRGLERLSTQENRSLTELLAVAVEELLGRRLGEE